MSILLIISVGVLWAWLTVSVPWAVRQSRRNRVNEMRTRQRKLEAQLGYTPTPLWQDILP